MLFVLRDDNGRQRRIQNVESLGVLLAKLKGRAVFEQRGTPLLEHMASEQSWVELADKSDFSSMLALRIPEVHVRRVNREALCNVMVVCCGDTGCQAQQVATMLEASNRFHVQNLPNEGEWLRQSTLGRTPQPR